MVNVKLTSSEVYGLIDLLKDAIRDQEDLLPDYKARIMIDSWTRTKDRLEASLKPDV